MTVNAQLIIIPMKLSWEFGVPLVFLLVSRASLLTCIKSYTSQRGCIADACSDIGCLYHAMRCTYSTGDLYVYCSCGTTINNIFTMRVTIRTRHSNFNRLTRTWMRVTTGSKNGVWYQLTTRNGNVDSVSQIFSRQFGRKQMITKEMYIR